MKTRPLFLLAVLLFPLGSPLSAAVVQISGGGTALDGPWAAATPGTIFEITDSLTYSPAVKLIAEAATHNNVTLRAAPGQSPTLNFTVGAFDPFLVRAEVAGLQIGSNSGGRIRMECGGGLLGIIQLNDARQVTLENLELVGVSGSSDCAVRIDAATPADSSPRVFVINNCIFRNWNKLDDGVLYLREVPGSASVNDSYPASLDITITDCLFDNVIRAWLVRQAGDHGAVTDRSKLHIENCRVINPTASGSLCIMFGDFIDVTIHNLLATRGSAGYSFTAGDLFYGTGRGLNLTITRSAFNRGRWQVGQGATVVIDHCDMISETGGIYIDPSATGSVSATNSNFISTAGSSLFSQAAGSPTLISDYNNCPQGYSGWTAGPHDVSISDPGYADVPNDWRVSASALVGDASDGGDIGSAIFLDPFDNAVPVELSEFVVN